MIHTVKGFCIVDEAEVDVFWNSLAFFMIQQTLAICCLSYVNLLFFFFYNIVSLYFLRIAFEASNLIQKFLNHKDNKFSRLLAVIPDARMNGTISKY